MKAQFITLFLLIISIPFSFSQVNITGSVVDAYSNEDLIGAIIIYGKGKSVSADIDGNFKFNIPKGERTITVRYLGYTSESKTIYAAGLDVFVLKSPTSTNTNCPFSLFITFDFSRMRTTRFVT